MTDIQQNCYWAIPDSGKGAGVLLLHAWWGLNDFFKDLCQHLAQQGFVVLAPDLYQGRIATTIGEAEKLRKKVDRKSADEMILASVDALLTSPAVTGSALGVIGFSLGGNWALWLSCMRPRAVKAVTIFYANGNFDYTAAQASYLGHFAETDEWVAASGVKKLEKTLRTSHRPATFYTYEGTGHWFFERDRQDAYNDSAAQTAWQRTLAFFQTELNK